MKAEDVSYSHGEVALSGQLAGDAAQARAGVVLFGDVWGMSDALRRRAGMMAELGYLALAADMYGGGRKAESHPEARGLVAPFIEDGVLLRARASAAADILRGRLPPDRPVLAIGYCFGGKVALELARSGSDLAAVASFHGSLQTASPAGSGMVRAAILVQTGGDDPMVPPAQVAAFEDEMRQAGADWLVVTHGGAAHGFAVPGSELWNIPGVAHHPAADRRSWQLMRAFFDDVLGA